MSVVADNAKIILRGNCGVEDAETLLDLIGVHTGYAIDVSEAAHLHGAVAQVLLATGAPIAGTARDPLTQLWLSKPA